MKRAASEGSLLSTVFVDYDNIYLSLKRKSEEAAKRFAKDAGVWLAEIASGRLITPTNGPALDIPRRIVMNRCYGNPVPRRNAHDNSTDMNSFPFVRHHFLRAGFEVIDCPPLTAQLKNSADIRMVMDVRDYLLHDTYFDEFIILSGDADFTPVLHRLRQHARRTVIYANDYTAAPYTAISDGEVRESDLIAALLEGKVPEAIADGHGDRKTLPNPSGMSEARKAIIADVLSHIRAEKQPMLLEVLADRAVRTLGRDLTVGTAWGGAGSFRDLLVSELPDGIEVTEHAPHYVLDTNAPSPGAESRPQSHAPSSFGDVRPEPLVAQPASPAQQKPDMGAATSRAPADRSPLGLGSPEPQRLAATNTPVARQEPRAEAPAPATDDFFRTPAYPGAGHESHAAPRHDPRHEQRPAASHAPAQQSPATGRAGQDNIRVTVQSSAPATIIHPGPDGSYDFNRTQKPEQAPAQPESYRPAAAARPAQPAPAAQPTQQPAPERTAAPARQTQSPDTASAIQKSIARIHEACQAPPISPPEYRVLFDVMAEEINANGLTGTQTLVNICERAKAVGVDVRKDDARFILEVVSEADPWFEQGASAALFASRFRNFVIARCKGQGLQLSATELDLIEAWFTGAAPRLAADKHLAQGADHGVHPQQPGPARDARAPQSQSWFGDNPQMQAGQQPQRGQQHPAYAAGGPEQTDFGRYSEEPDDFPRVLRRDRA